MPKDAAVGAGALDAAVTVEPTPGVDPSPPPSMAPGSGYKPDAKKVHRSPPKEKIYPKWKPGDRHPSWQEPE